VTHAAITENKHLSVVLEHIKAEQVKVAPKKRRAGKQATRCQPTGKRNDGWNSKLTNELRRRPRNPHHAPHNDPDRMAGQGCDV
jgi:ribosomal protein S14